MDLRSFRDAIQEQLLRPETAQKRGVAKRVALSDSLQDDGDGVHRTAGLFCKGIRKVGLRRSLAIDDVDTTRKRP